MNLSLPIITVDSEWRGADVIPATELAQMLQAEDIVCRARRQAAAYLQTARRQRKRWRAKNRLYLRQCQQAQRRYYIKSFREAREAGSAAAISWLVEQNRWQQGAYRHLTRQIGRQLAQRLRNMSGSFPWEQLLESEVTALYREFQQEPGLTLRVSPEMFASLPDALTALPINIECGSDLNRGHALLENHLVRIELKLSRQLEQLCEALETLTWEQLNEPD